jgi:hypothetical protein
LEGKDKFTKRNAEETKGYDLTKMGVNRFRDKLRDDPPQETIV